MKTKIITLITVLISAISYSQETKNELFDSGIGAITTDVNSLTLQDGLTYLNLDINMIQKLNEVEINLPDIFILQGKIGVAYSNVKILDESTSNVFIPLHLGVGVGHSKSNYGIYSTISIGSDILSVFKEDEDVSICSHINIGGSYFFGENSKYGLITEYSYALKGGDMISVGLALKI